MCTVAIICEYNPFHNGHKYQIDKIREHFGEETNIVAIMSGNYTQRGDIAIADKLLRAECAVNSGVNLVLEIPFPYSVSSAEFYARSGVEIADKIGIVDFLSFGSECGDINALKKYAEITLTDEYRSTVSKLEKETATKKYGYAKLCELAMAELLHQNMKIELSPNNILAIEYIKALIRLKSKIEPHTIKRDGADYRDKNITHESRQSATAIRESLLGGVSALEYVPKSTKSIICKAIEKKEMPTVPSRLDAAVISSLRLNSPSQCTRIQDAGGGLYNRLISNSFKANDILTLLALTETKKYTRARIKRVIWYSFFGVTSSEFNTPPLYTQVLAMDGKGKAMLKKIGKQGEIPVLTKPSKLDGLSEAALRQKNLADKADSIFQLTKPVPADGCFSLKFTPFIKSE